MERAMQLIANSRRLLVPAGEETCGHGTNGWLASTSVSCTNRYKRPRAGSVINAPAAYSKPLAIRSVFLYGMNVRSPKRNGRRYEPLPRHRSPIRL